MIARELKTTRAKILMKLVDNQKSLSIKIQFWMYNIVKELKTTETIIKYTGNTEREERDK